MTATVAATSHLRTAPPASLDGLLALDVPALDALYASASAPRLDEVQGDLRGRMLATTVLRGPLAGAVRSLASSDAFPWKGKTFAPRSSLRGDGINRVVRDRWRLFRFETYVGPSRAGSFDALQLDYDNRDNPFFIRPIKDEMRALTSGLWLGQAYLELRGKATLVLYFALAARRELT